MQKPKNIHSVHWHPKFIDCFTIVLKKETKCMLNFDALECLSMSNHPNDPMGVSYFGTCSIDWAKDPKNRIRWDELPEHIQNHAIERLS